MRDREKELLHQWHASAQRVVIGDKSMNKFQRVFNWLLLIYCAAFVLYMFNLAAPPNNMPIFIVMAVIAVVAASLSRTKKKVVVALLMAVVALLLIVKEHNDGVALKSKVDKARQQSQQLERR